MQMKSLLCSADLDTLQLHNAGKAPHKAPRRGSTQDTIDSSVSGAFLQFPLSQNISISSYRLLSIRCSLRWRSWRLEWRQIVFNSLFFYFTREDFFVLLCDCVFLRLFRFVLRREETKLQQLNFGYPRSIDEATTSKRGKSRGCLCTAGEWSQGTTTTKRLRMTSVNDFFVQKLSTKSQRCSFPSDSRFSTRSTGGTTWAPARTRRRYDMNTC